MPELTPDRAPENRPPTLRPPEPRMPALRPPAPRAPDLRVPAPRPRDVRFPDRREAGRRLAARLAGLAGRHDLLVLGLPRGGIPVAYEVARALGAPLDAFVVRKLGIPGHEELAMGAIASGGIRVLEAESIARHGVRRDELEAVTVAERRELERRERAYRGGRVPPNVWRRTVVLVDDGLATGATMHAAVAALRQREPARIVVAVPVAAPDACASMRRDADDCLALLTPEPFLGVGAWYADFSPTSDEEVRALLAEAARAMQRPRARR